MPVVARKAKRCARVSGRVVLTTLLGAAILWPDAARAGSPPVEAPPREAGELGGFDEGASGVAIAPVRPVDAAPSSTRAPEPEVPPGIVVKIGGAEDGASAGPLELSVGASYWVRGQMGFDPAGEAPPSWGVPQRVRGSIGVRWRQLGTFVQFQDVRDWGSEASTLETMPNTGLHQGYMEVAGERAGPSGRVSGSLRLGRQSMALGSMRLLGDAPWNPNGQAFNGLRLRGEVKAPRGTVFGVDSLVALTRAPVPGHDDAGNWFGVAQFYAFPHPAFAVESYVFGELRSPSPDRPELGRATVTPGLRVHGEPLAGLEYDFEGYVQTGRFEGAPHTAWAGAATLRYELGAGASRWRVRPAGLVAYTVASGSACEGSPEAASACSTTGTHRNFDPLYGSRHRYLGFGDWLAPTNVRAFQVGPELSVRRWLRARVHYHYFRLDDPGGPWIRANLSSVGEHWAPGARDRDLGHEIDTRLEFRPWIPLVVDMGHAVLVPVGTGARLSSPRPQHFVYLMVGVSF